MFGAPWGREVIVMSLLGSVVLATPIVIQVLLGYWLIPAVLITIVSAVTLQCVRGYSIGRGELRIRRLFWDTIWPLDPGARATVKENAMHGSWRVWGNGGLFAITGRFSGSGLGRYHAFVTDPARTVIVTTQQGIVVVSPDRPDEFAATIEQLRYSRTP